MENEEPQNIEKLLTNVYMVYLMIFKRDTVQHLNKT